MSIVMMGKQSDAGAYELANYPGASGPLWMVESYKGAVLSVWERNGYDDSDFYATVWAEGGPFDVMYASTRGWTYPNSASVDATPEVLAAYKAWKAAAAEKSAAAAAKLKAGVPAKGDRVVLSGLRKRAELNGKDGEVFWFGIDGFKAKSANRYNSSPLPRQPMRVGVMVGSEKLFVDAERAEVPGAGMSCQAAVDAIRIGSLLAGYSARPGI